MVGKGLWLQLLPACLWQGQLGAGRVHVRCLVSLLALLQQG